MTTRIAHVISGGARPGHRRGGPQQARRHRQRDGADAAEKLLLADREGRARRLRQPVHAARARRWRRRWRSRSIWRPSFPASRRILAEFPLESMREGDIYCMNDPYLGGTHLPDIAVVTPVFARGRPIAFAATMTHHQDVGGMAPGSVPTNATEIFQEGIRIPPLKLREGRPLQRHAAEDPAPQRAHPRHLRGRPEGAGGGLHGRRAPPVRRWRRPTATTS